MNLDDVTAELRPRGPWEAVDFGARMVRRDARVIYKLWFAITLPMVALASVAMFHVENPLWVMLVYWWCEPIVDGAILHVISRRLFGERVSFREALAMTPGFAMRNWVFLLTPMRFHMARSVALPVVQLEQLRGSQRRSRAKVLNQLVLNHGIGVSLAYQHLVVCINLGIALLALSLIPEAYQDTVALSWYQLLFESAGPLSYLVNFYLFYIAQSALHPWFVGAGFGLYINCRTMLEAWDIEIAFRRMLQRRASRIGATAGLLAVFVVAGWNGQAYAQNAEIEPLWDEATVEESLETVYASEELQTTATRETWQRIPDEEAEESPPEEEETDTLRDFFRSVGEFISFLVEFSLWFLAVLVVAILVATYKRWVPYLTPLERTTSGRRRVVLATGEITAESLPDNVPSEVRGLWREGRHRDAMGLLYRASVFGAVERHGVRLPKSATEGSCMAAVRRQSSVGHAAYFGRVVAAWSWCAYGALVPQESVVDALCNEWPQQYEGNS